MMHLGMVQRMMKEKKEHMKVETLKILRLQKTPKETEQMGPKT